MRATPSGRLATVLPLLSCRSTTRCDRCAKRVDRTGLVRSRAFLRRGFHGYVDLRDATTPEGSRVDQGVRRHVAPPGEWIVGGVWDHELWARGRRCQVASGSIQSHLITRCLSATRWPYGIAIRGALELAGITASPADIALRNHRARSAGAPTGLLKDEAMVPGSRDPRSSAEQADSAVARAMGHPSQRADVGFRCFRHLV